MYSPRPWDTPNRCPVRRSPLFGGSVSRVLSDYWSEDNIRSFKSFTDDDANICLPSGVAAAAYRRVRIFIMVYCQGEFTGKLAE